VFVLLVVFTARYLSDADLGYHLRGGQWMLEHHGFPSKDTYTYTRSSADYLDLHWLYQILIYATYVIGGYTALSLLNIVLVAVAFALAAKRVQRTGAPMWIGAPWAFGKRALAVTALESCAAGIGRIETTIGPWNLPAGRHSMDVRHIATFLPCLTCHRSIPASTPRCSGSPGTSSQAKARAQRQKKEDR
jgi:hypothetical protein